LVTSVATTPVSLTRFVVLVVLAVPAPAEPKPKIAFLDTTGAAGVTELLASLAALGPYELNAATAAV
jgi:hypothetical protein